MKKIISAILCLTLVFSAVGTVFASETTYEDNTVQVFMLDENKIIVKEIDTNETSMINFEERGQIEKTTVRNLNTGEEYYFIRDNEKNTLYSSMTDYKGSLENIKTEEILKSNLKASTTTQKISYKTLAAYVAIGAGAATVVAGIVGIVGIAAAAGFVTIVAGVLTIINGGLALADDKSGVKITIKEEKREKMQGGQKYTFYVKVISNLTTY